jgi:hypothetical protein
MGDTVAHFWAWQAAVHAGSRVPIPSPRRRPWLLGEALLVSPVLEPQQDSKDVYLPAGTWYHISPDAADFSYMPGLRKHLHSKQLWPASIRNVSAQMLTL